MKKMLKIFTAAAILAGMSVTAAAETADELVYKSRLTAFVDVYNRMNCDLGVLAGKTNNKADITVKSSAYLANGLNKLMPEDQNYMFSPLSIKMALSLAANGAEDETLEQLLAAEGIDDLDEYNRYAKQLINDYSKKENVSLAIANSLWLNTDRASGVSFKDAYLKTTENYYNAKLDFVNNSNAVEKINSWCSKNTNGKIPKLTNSADFTAVLANAVYFKGDWEVPFEKELTNKRDFTDRKGKKTSIDFMNNTDDFRFYENGNLKILEMPYKGGDTVMYAVLGNDKREDVTQYFDKMGREEVRVSIPKFKTEYSVTLNEMLKNLGITTAFSPYEAQFGKMFDGPDEYNFYIDKVIHKTFIEVDETGTEAAAVTGIFMDTTSAIEEPGIIKEFIADRPFEYLIVDKNTNEILFMGEYAYAK